jgi:hypothetical protein
MRGIPRASEVLDAVRRATPESRAAFEERCGSIVMGINIIAPEDEGGWVETRTLTEAGEIERSSTKEALQRLSTSADRPAGRYRPAASARHWFSR